MAIRNIRRIRKISMFPDVSRIEITINLSTHFSQQLPTLARDWCGRSKGLLTVRYGVIFVWHPPHLLVFIVIITSFVYVDLCLLLRTVATPDHTPIVVVVAVVEMLCCVVVIVVPHDRVLDNWPEH